MKKISELIDTNLDIDILGIDEDSRNIKEGYLFVATKGFNVDHYDYIEDAINNGCSFVICDREINYDIPHMVVDNINDLYPKLISKFYDLDLDNFNFIGITGTDGKTTTTYIIKKLLDNIKPCGYIGTNGVEVDDKHITSNNTTPCISELYSYLDFINNYSNEVVMEVSSEALLHDRVNSLKFDIVGFTNITEDHLNVHKTLDNYINCKLKLLDYLKDDGVCIYNGDDSNLKKINTKNKISYGFNSDNNWVISDIRNQSDKTTFIIRNGEEYYKIYSPFIGKYNVYNVTLAFLTLYYYGLNPEYIVDYISVLKPVPGRGERIDFGQDFEIILDYAHTYNGIVNIIETYKDKEIIIVTGCAGGREKEKRGKIGKYILDNTSIPIFTMDDPRNERVNAIIDDMASLSDKKFLRIVERDRAIWVALSLATSNCVVLILGKGRDNYMAIKDKKVPYSDYDSIKSYFNKRKRS